MLGADHITVNKSLFKSSEFKVLKEKLYAGC